MHAIALVVASLALVAHGTRVKTTSEQMQAEPYVKDQDSQKAGKTTLNSHSLAELEQSQSNTKPGVSAVLAMLLLALNNPAAAFPLNMTGMRGGVRNTGLSRGRLAQISLQNPGPLPKFRSALKAGAGDGHDWTAKNGSHPFNLTGLSSGLSPLLEDLVAADKAVKRLTL